MNQTFTDGNGSCGATEGDGSGRTAHLGCEEPRKKRDYYTVRTWYDPKAGECITAEYRRDGKAYRVVVPSHWKILLDNDPRWDTGRPPRPGEVQFTDLYPPYDPNAPEPWSAARRRRPRRRERPEIHSCSLRNEAARIEFQAPVPASALKQADEAEEWVWDGYLYKRSVTLFSALWKGGKTTLLAHLLHATGGGGSLCGRAVQPCRVLTVSEESGGLWAKRRDTLGIGDHAFFLPRPFWTKPSPDQWLAFVLFLRQRVEKDGFGLVILDTLGSFWSVARENEASEVQAALMPLRMLTDAGAAVLLVHHFRKGDGTEATASRGSGALCGFVDTILEFRRYNALDRKDRKRVITGYGRYAGTPDEVVIELSEDGKTYAAHGDRHEVGQAERLKIITGLLPADEPGVTAEELYDAWKAEPKPAKRTLASDLRHGVEGERWTVTGAGKKGDPFRYRRG
jgi:hypothetical protein